MYEIVVAIGTILMLIWNLKNLNRNKHKED